MKKVLKCMGMMALVALAFTSCKKNEDTKRSFYASGAALRIQNVREDRPYADVPTILPLQPGEVCMVVHIY